ncbi:hypothetical protein HDV02_001917 [Globomyces sp. JEL0801]|nr:hypothetical protein HDV02_001917 [Globomyces sp. JEL0801]
MLFNGTLAVNGEAYGVVIRTGDNTVIGQIAFMTSSEDRRPSPMSAEIENYVTLIASMPLFVPQGLPTTVSVLLSLAAKRMASRNVLVKDLQSVETLGAITLLATDKTGTLTKNQMTVTYVWSGDKLYYCPAVAEQGVDAIPFDLNRTGPNEVLHMSALCSRARFENNEGPIATRPILGDATEAGLLRNAAQKILDFEKLHDNYPKVFEIPFNSDNKWAMTIHKKKHANGSLTLYLKGAPERVLRLCSTFQDGKNIVPLTEEHKKKYDRTYGFMASKGHRVLAFAALQLPGDKYPAFHEFKKDLGNYPQKDLTFYGLVSLEDPPKHGVREAIGHCREAGIRVMMVTGDHPLTAESIGRKINLMLQDTKESLAAKRGCDISQIREDEVNAVVIHGEQIDDLAEEDWDRIFSKEEIIFARTSPKHKLTIVKHAQALGHIVGVTGDGVNDSPALKKADLGIAMNISGSDVSKEAAAMILVDDNFASCINGIEEGRLIFQNLKKSIKYTITHTMPEAWANLMNIAIPMPLAMSPMLILVSDLGFEMFLALSFAWDVPENRAGLMKLQPRKPVTDKLVARLKDAEKNGPPSFSKRMHQKFFDPVEEEVLIDQGVLSWAFLEVGTIETIACFTCYFFSMYYTYGVTPSDQIKNADDYGLKEFTLSNGKLFDVDTQIKALFVGNAAFYFCLMITQSFNMMCCKARLGLPFGAFMLANPMNFYGILFAVAFCSCVVYIPFVNVVFTSNYLMTGYVWLIAFGFGVIIYIYAIIRTLILRARNPVKYSKDIQGLDLHPTRFSTGR